MTTGEVRKGTATKRSSRKFRAPKSAHISGVLVQLRMVRRFVIGWVGLLVICALGLGIQINDTLADLPNQSSRSSMYREAVVGRITTINPLLPEGSASADAVKLIFNGLVKADPTGRIIADLAESWNISPDGKIYTFTLRKGVLWHDGVPFTANDVAFTMLAAGNPDSRSPFQADFKDVKTVIKDESTIQVILPKPYTPFLYTMQIGIIPRHLFGSVDPSSFRVAAPNTHPVGTGPYKFKELDVDKLELIANPNYFGGRPGIRTISLKTFTGSATALEAYARKQVDAVKEISLDDTTQASQYEDLKIRELSSFDTAFVFFKTTNPALSEPAVRRALGLSLDKHMVVEEAVRGYGLVVDDPIPSLNKSSYKNLRPSRLDTSSAETILDLAGWKKVGGLRQKAGKKLNLKLVTQKDTAYARAAVEIRRQWQKLGVEVDVKVYEQAVFHETYLRPRNYDVLVYGISNGPDPDAYSVWHSSQIKDPGLNLSVYGNKSADRALESGRTVSDDATRLVKYQQFVKQWYADMPAIALYRSNYLYAQSEDVRGVLLDTLPQPADRFNQVEKWKIGN